MSFAQGACPIRCSFSVVGVFEGAIWKMNFPSLITNKVEHLKCDVVREFKNEIASSGFEKGLVYKSLASVGLPSPLQGRV